MMITKLIIAGVLVALEGVRLASCLECVQGSASEVDTIDAAKSSTKSTCRTLGSTNCHVLFNRHERLNLTFGCGNCSSAGNLTDIYCTECTTAGDGCNGVDKEPFAKNITGYLKCLSYYGDTSALPRPMTEIYCRLSYYQKCNRMTHSNKTFFGCYGDCYEVEWPAVIGREKHTRCAECTPNALKNDCVLSSGSGVETPETDGTRKAGTTPGTDGTRKAGTTPGTDGTAKAGTTPGTDGTTEAKAASHQTSPAGYVLLASAMMLVTLLPALQSSCRVLCWLNQKFSV